jgi:phage gp46-like protein
LKVLVRNWWVSAPAAVALGGILWALHSKKQLNVSTGIRESSPVIASAVSLILLLEMSRMSSAHAAAAPATTGA